MWQQEVLWCAAIAGSSHVAVPQQHVASFYLSHLHKRGNMAGLMDYGWLLVHGCAL